MDEHFPRQSTERRKNDQSPGGIDVMVEALSTREACGIALLNLGYEEENIVVLDADLSVSTQTKKFADKFPKRFFNVGCAEQNLMELQQDWLLEAKSPSQAHMPCF